MLSEKKLKCPVCGAAFRRERNCTRCKADLEPLMVIAGKAHFFKQAARNALLIGDFERAAEHARKSLSLHATENGKRLFLLTRWLLSLRNKHQHT